MNYKYHEMIFFKSLFTIKYIRVPPKISSRSLRGYAHPTLKSTNLDELQFFNQPVIKSGFRFKINWNDNPMVAPCFESLKCDLTLVLNTVIQQVHPCGPGVGKGQQQQCAQQHLRRSNTQLECSEWLLFSYFSHSRTIVPVRLQFSDRDFGSYGMSRACRSIGV